MPDTFTSTFYLLIIMTVHGGEGETLVRVERGGMVGHMQGLCKVKLRYSSKIVYIPVVNPGIPWRVSSHTSGMMGFIC